MTAFLDLRPWTECPICGTHFDRAFYYEVCNKCAPNYKGMLTHNPEWELVLPYAEDLINPITRKQYDFKT